MYSTLMQLIHQYIPMSKQHGRSAHTLEFLSHNVRRIFLHKRKTWHRWRRVLFLEHKIAYEMANKDCSRHIRYYRAHEEEDLHAASPQQFFK